MKEPFFKAKTGDPILSVHWNDMQVKVREEIADLIRTHQHTGGDQGTKLGGNGIDLQTTLMANKGLTVSYGNSPKQSLTVDGSTGDITTSSVVDVKAGLRIEGIKITKFATTLSASNAPADAIPTAAAVQSYVSNAVSAVSSSASGSLTVNTLTVGDKGTKLNTDGTATIGGSLTVGSSASIAGALTVGASGTKLNADGTASIGGDLTVGGAKGTTLHADGRATIAGELTVGSTKLNTDGTATIGGDLTVGATKLNKDGTASIAGKLTANGGLDVAGALSVGSLTITGALRVGTLSVDAVSFGQEKIRIVRGTVTPILDKDRGVYTLVCDGEGVSVKTNFSDGDPRSCGVYIVTFLPLFSAPPTVVVTAQPHYLASLFATSTLRNAIAWDVKTSGFVVKVGNDQGQGDATTPFHFIALGM